MTRRAHTSFGPIAWRAVASLSVLLLALRALVAPGFMPDLGALRDGGFEIVLCTPLGAKTVQAHSDGQPAEADRPLKTDVRDGDECPFQHATFQTLAPPGQALLKVEFGRSPPLRLVPARLSPKPAPTGPPLGSRAPPSFVA